MSDDAVHRRAVTDPVEAACIAFVEHPAREVRWVDLPPAARVAVGLGMQPALAAYERALWVPVEHASAEWEGAVVLFSHPDGRPVEQRLLPHGYSRDPRHCCGIMVRKLPVPPNVGEKPAWTRLT